MRSLLTMESFIRSFILVALSCLAGHQLVAPMGIGATTADASAVLNGRAVNKGLLIPQVNLSTLTDGTTVSAPATGLLVVNGNTAISGGVGFYYNAGWLAAPRRTKVHPGVASAGSGWRLSGNAVTNSPDHYPGTTDLLPLLERHLHLQRPGPQYRRHLRRHPAGNGRLVRLGQRLLILSAPSPRYISVKSFGSALQAFFGAGGEVPSCTSKTIISASRPATWPNSRARLVAVRGTGAAAVSATRRASQCRSPTGSGGAPR